MKFLIVFFSILVLAAGGCLSSSPKTQPLNVIILMDSLSSENKNNAADDFALAFALDHSCSGLELRRHSTWKMRNAAHPLEPLFPENKQYGYLHVYHYDGGFIPGAESLGRYENFSWSMRINQTDAFFENTEPNFTSAAHNVCMIVKNQGGVVR